jgi:ABC-type transporter Mla MlaB component
VDNTGTGLPETDIVLGTGSREEVVNLLVDVNSTSKILSTTNLSLNQVVTVDSSRVGNLVHASGHELENGHLSGSILASNTIRSQLEVALTTLDILAMGISQVRVQNLLGICQGSVQTRADDVKVFGHLLIVDVVTLLPVVLADLYKQSQLVSCPSKYFSF